jgi:hypothetical protein
VDEIATIKHEVKMNEWNRQVMSWRESGLSATAWCKQENIPSSTFFYRLKQVDAVNKGDCIFEQLPVLSETHPIDTIELDNRIKVTKGEKYSFSITAEEVTPISQLTFYTSADDGSLCCRIHGGDTDY